MRAARTAAAAATTLIGATATALAAGRFASDAILKVPSGRPLPGDPRLTVHAVDGSRVTLTRALAALRPGVYGLTDPTGHTVHAVVGPVLDDIPHSADTVVRALDRIAEGALEPGASVRLTPELHHGDPATALGIAHSDIAVPGELGPLPGWLVPGPRDTWVIAVHGLGTTRAHPLNLLPFLHGRRVPVLAVGYRGDPDAPRPPDGLSRLGDAEWRDLDAALRFAVRHGANKVVLYGWSTGATMALHAAANSPLRDRVSGLVLDSPVLDKGATLRALAAARHTPGPLVPFAVRAAQSRAGLYGAPRMTMADAQAIRVPVLIFHGPDDALAPWGPSRELAAGHPRLISLHTVRDAPHAAMWNADPARYEEALRRFLTPLM
ncbi:alpha/beta hydrolase [Streptomyces sp. NPDC057638]|uniref:alpha/beta hydrolase n=1 Tax=Streptomyces sp. NPDC057638 TaxID=3346190 RepID=UPI003689B416